MCRRFLFIVLFGLIAAFAVDAQTTAFTYQGKMLDGTQPAAANYDFEFRLYDAATAGTQLGSTLSRPGVVVAGGIFTVNLDFGAQFTGADRFLDISARAAGGGAFTPLLPRQLITAAPYAITSQTAANFSGSLAGNVTGTQSSTVVAVVGGASAANVAAGANAANAATSANTANTIVKRDASGNFAAGTITGNGSGLTNVNAATGGSSASNYLFAYDSSLQALPNSFFVNVIFGINGQVNGWTHTAGSAIFVCPQSGIYLIGYNATASSTTAGPTITMRSMANGVEIAGSQSVIGTALSGAPVQVSKTFVTNLNAGDLVTIQSASNANGTFLLNTGAGSTPVSASVTIVRLQ